MGLEIHMETSFWIVDTFSDNVFRGNPAAVLFVDELSDCALLQNIAMEINALETIFVKELYDGNFEALCFTPKIRGLYLGNGLFAAAKVINDRKPAVRRFNIICGIRIFLVNILDNGDVSIRFSTVELEKVPIPTNLSAALNDEIVVSIAAGKDELIVEMRSPSKLLNLSPNLDILGGIAYDSFILTTDTHYEVNADYDFGVRVFAPKLGIFRDMLTPIAATKLVAYWTGRMEKKELVGFQPSSDKTSYVSARYGSEFTNLTCRCVISVYGHILLHAGGEHLETAVL
jgi:PhzF family phenazine biosynthesis protein